MLTNELAFGLAVKERCMASHNVSGDDSTELWSFFLKVIGDPGIASAFDVFLACTAFGSDANKCLGYRPC